MMTEVTKPDRGYCVVSWHIREYSLTLIRK